MARSNAVAIWKLMNDYKFVPDPDTINDDMSCIICKNLMIDPCHCVCGCQYCRKCITEYSGNSDKFCPGNKLKCKEEYLSLTTDIMSDKRMNNKIFKSKVFCPNDWCKIKIELIHMPEHLEECRKQSTECPYVKIGCDNGEQTKDSISVHLDDDTLPHIHLLIDYIHNLKNEVDAMKSEIFSLKENSRMKDMQIGEMTELRRELNNRILNLTNKLHSMEEDSKLTEKRMDKEKREAKEEVTILKKEIKSVKAKCTQKENKIATLEGQLRDVNGGMESRLSAMMEEGAKMNRETEEGIIGRMEAQNKKINDRINEQKKEIKKQIINEKEARMNDWIKSCPNKNADFIWRIDGWTKKRRSMEKEWFHSESFYSKNYKFCLRLGIQDDDRIWLGCVIMRGTYDCKVDWPMRYEVTFSIINRDSQKAHKSVKLKYNPYVDNIEPYDKPTSDMNFCAIGTDTLIKYSSIKDNPSIFVDDSIVVSCILTDL